jgi:hypothetical protein
MKSLSRRTLALATVSLSIVALTAYAQAPDGPTRLTTEFRGPGLCLDVVNGGPRNHQAWLDTCQDVTGQSWIFEPAPGGMAAAVVGRAAAGADPVEHREKGERADQYDSKRGAPAERCAVHRPGPRSASAKAA